MSGQVTGWLLRGGPRPTDVDRDGEPYGLARARAMRAVLLPIADASNRDGEEAHPGIEHIIEASLYSRRQVFRIIDDAIAEGWLEVTEHPRRGTATTYRVRMDWRVTVAPQRSDDGVPSAPQWGAKSDPMGCHGAEQPPRSRHGDGTPDVLTVDTDGIPTVSTPSAADGVSEAERLCTLLATAIDTHTGAGRPKVTAAWRRDMRLLLERGELGIEGAKGRSPEVIERAIGFTFGRLAERGGDGFCWADQVRSPGALRRHWPKLAAAKAKLEQGAGVSKGARTIDRVAQRLAGENGDLPRQPLGALLPGPTNGGLSTHA